MSIINDMRLLHPKFARAAVKLRQNLALAYETGVTKTNFQVFETFRHPSRQNELFAKGTSKARQFTSAHQLGMAVDMVPYLSAEEATALAERINERVLPGWSWHSSHDYDFLRKEARKVGLDVPIVWDRVHVEHPDWPLLMEFVNNKMREK